MIIATKTRIKVMYAAKSSRSNSRSSGVEDVEFISFTKTTKSQNLHPRMAVLVHHSIQLGNKTANGVGVLDRDV